MSMCLYAFIHSFIHSLFLISASKIEKNRPMTKERT